MASWKNCGKLSLKCLGEVLEELYDVNTKWYTIGLRLQLTPACLGRIKESCSKDPAECFREMLKKWLECFEDCSWSVLIAALRSKSVGEYSLAKRIEEKAHNHTGKEELSSGTSDIYLPLKGTYIELSPSSPTYNHDSQSSDASAASTDVDRHTAYGCGCGKCSLNTFLDGRCPDPEKAATSFPYLKISALTESEKMILKGRLSEDFCKISMQFSEFNTAICESLINRKIPVQRVTRMLRDLRAFPPSSSNAPLLGSHLDAITQDKTIDDIFDILAHYVSFFNFQITEHIVKNLGTNDDKVLLCDYKKKVDEYCNRNIFECPSYSTPHQEQAALVLKVEGIEQYSMKHLSMLISHVSRALSIANNSLRLCSVEEGCVKLNFQVPLCVKDSVFPLSTECIGRLMDLGKSMNKPVHITVIKCGFYLYKIPLSSNKTVKKVVMDKGCIYNHGDLSRTEAESILSSVDYNCFLVRQSSNAVGCVIYSYKDFGVFNHVKQEGTINRDFIHKTERSVCLMPVHLDVQVMEPERCMEDKSRAMSDYGSDSESDFTGDSTGDCTGTGDSAIILGSALPVAKKQSSLNLKAEKYERLNPKGLDKPHTYCKLEKKK